MINAAIIGLGWWGKNIVNSVQGRSSMLRFVHGVSKEPDAVADFARRHGFALSTSLDDALRDNAVQAVVLATPHSTHAEQIVQVARAGKPVMCEKPLCLTRADAVRAIDACQAARVPIGVGQNKRFWPAMRELRAVVKSGALGTLLHVEGHYSNENSSMNFADWRADPRETPGAGLTGTGIHILDAFASIAGPTDTVHAQFHSVKPDPDPFDALSVHFRFANGLSGYLGAVRPSPIFWRVHVFGTLGSAEALGENELVLRLKGKGTQRNTYPPLDSLLHEFDAFALAAAGRAPYPITPQEMIDTIGAFEGVYRSLESGQSFKVAR